MTIDQFTKQALWESCNKKCFYCREVLAFKNIQIDHIIPEIVFNGFENEIRTKYKLSPSFDFNSLDNYAPACFSCNSTRKRAKELENGVPLWLDEVGSKKSNVIAHAGNLRNEMSLDLPDQYKEFFLSSPDFMLSGLSIDRIRKKDIDIYKHLAFSSIYYPLHLTAPFNKKEKVHITNLAQYELYKNRSYYAATIPEIGLASKCDACLVFFDKFQNAITVAKKIELKDYYHLLPCNLLHITGPEEDFEFRDFDTIGDYLDSHSNIKIEVASSSVTLEFFVPEYNGRNEFYLIEEILHANFSGDGQSEPLIFLHYHSSGTFHYSFAVQLKNFNGKWTIQEKL